MSDSVTVNVEVTEAPFGVKGSVSVNESVFDTPRIQFEQGVEQELHRLSGQLYDLAMSEYDRRKNAGS